MRKLLILDLDETLIHGKPGGAGADFHAAGIPVFIRPGARAFIEDMAAVFDLAVWTSASSDYAADIVRELFTRPLRFLWSRERCVRLFHPETYETTFVKDLKKVRRQGWNLAHVIAVDDSPEKFARSYGNLVRVPPFTGERDEVLLLLSAYLRTIAHEPDVRRVEKRYWLSKGIKSKAH